MNSSKLDTALAYAAKGILVFPCQPRSKDPIGEKVWVEELEEYKGGFYLATTEEEKIRKWWNDNPEYNVAIRTGVDSGLLVIDVDGDAGEETIREWAKKYDQPLQGPVVKTGKGRHIYLKHPGQTVGNWV